MKRTQIYLDQKTISLLTSLSTKTGKTRSELIREAISEAYSTDNVQEIVGKMAQLQSFANFGVSTETERERKW